MEEKINQNIARIKELTGKLIVIYGNNAAEREKENIDKIHLEIKIRTILDKIYTNKELSESNLMSLYKYIFEINNKENGYDDVYSDFEKCMLLNSYDIYKNKINELFEKENNFDKKKKVFYKIRKKVIGR